MKPLLRSQILARDDRKCTKCGGGVGLEVHHVKYRCDGGKDDPENLTTLCANCHLSMHQPDSWNNLLLINKSRAICRQQEQLDELRCRLGAALYGQDSVPCDVWWGGLVIYLPKNDLNLTTLG